MPAIGVVGVAAEDSADLGGDEMKGFALDVAQPMPVDAALHDALEVLGCMGVVAEVTVGLIALGQCLMDRGPA